MKESVRKLVDRLRGRGGGPTRAPRTQPPRTHPPADRPSEPSLPFVTDGRELKSGLTVFDDRALRLRSLTLADQAATGLEEPSAEQSAFKIRVAKREGFQHAAGTLVERRYGDRGYQTPARQPHDPNLFTFVAYDEGKLVGTVGIRLDSDTGLSADELYSDELEELRSAGCRLCEFTRLAVDFETVSKPVLASLFHTAYMFACELRGHDHAVIEVNPRHVLFYRRALLFEQIGEERLNLKVDAPAVLMCLPFERVPPQLEKYGGRPDLAKTTRVMYTYFFGAAEAAGIRNRLRDLDQAPAPRAAGAP
jgi:hypothetical protein